MEKYSVFIRIVSSVYMNGEVDYSYRIKGVYDTLEEARKHKERLISGGYKAEDINIQEG